MYDRYHLTAAYIALQRLGSSATSSKTYLRRYRSLAPSSQVDEDLFGSQKPVSVDPSTAPVYLCTMMLLDVVKYCMELQ